MPTNNQTNQQTCHTERSRSATVKRFNNSTVKLAKAFYLGITQLLILRQMNKRALIDKLDYLISSATETEVLELKEARTSFDTDKLGRYFSALSNEANLKGHNEAWLLLGVNNQKEITGTSISQQQTNGYKLEIAKHTSPALNFKEIHEVITTRGRVLMCEIPAAPNGMPVAWKGHHYGRDGESLGALNIGEIEQIRNQQRITDWSAQIVPEANLSDLSPEAIEMARFNLVSRRG
jgi:ATP-dependent DNA helicase RecG